MLWTCYFTLLEHKPNVLCCLVASVGRSGGETGASVKCPEHAFDGFSYVMPAHSKLCVSPT